VNRSARVAVATATVAAAWLCGAHAAGAQERLVGERVVGVGLSFDAVSFSGAGLAQAGFAGLDSARVRSVRQVAIPVSAAWPIGGGWRMDLTTLYASGTVAYRDQSAPTDRREATLAGPSDIRVRATGRLLHDAVVVTIGANAPTGRTSLDLDQFSALRVVSAPALGLGSSPVGAGPSGTIGVVTSREVGPWALAAGVSYEMRGTFQPVAALTAGSPSTDFRPGGVVRGSLAADRMIGAHRLNLAVATDVFAEDRLRGGTASTGDLARVQLGPVLSSDVQLQLGVRRLREWLVYGSHRWRAPFSRDGRTVRESSGTYIDAGTRGAVRVTRMADLFAGLDARWHSGLGIDQGVPTAGVRSGSTTIGASIRRGRMTLQPYLRAQAGTLVQRGIDVPSVSQGFVGVVPGFVLFTRF
jgi:hypothetical protein